MSNGMVHGYTTQMLLLAVEEIKAGNDVTIVAHTEDYARWFREQGFKAISVYMLGRAVRGYTGIFYIDNSVSDEQLREQGLCN